jgi:squalene synthase HpnC
MDDNVKSIDFSCTKSSMTSSEGVRTMSDVFFTRDEMLSKARNENFPVASRLLPSGVRSDLLAIYGFARLADDLGDEAEGDRLALLDLLNADLIRAASGTAVHPVLKELTPVIRKFELSLDPFQRLIEANRIDQRVNSYQSFDDLEEYCMYSAAPVGQLVLSVFGRSTAERVILSDKVCIALQLVEFLQDVKEDAQRGRVYLPVEDMTRFGCTPSDLVKANATTALKSLIAMEVDRARELFTAGVELAASLPLRPRMAVVGFVAGGTAALDAINRAGNDVLQFRCRPTKFGFAKHALPKLVTTSLRGAGL